LRNRLSKLFPTERWSSENICMEGNARVGESRRFYLAERPRGLDLDVAPDTATPPYLSPSGYDHRRVATPRRLTARLFGKGRSEANAVSVLVFKKSS